jgi:uncharacterized membrane protein
MKNLAMPGRWIFAIAILAFGVEHIIYARTGAGLGPPWTPENHALIYVIGIVLIAAGAGLASGKQVRLAAILVAAACVGRAVLYDVPTIIGVPHRPGPWTSGFELLAMGGASLVLAAMFTPQNSARGPLGGPAGVLFQLGRCLFGVSLVVFGVQHLMYGPFVASLVTAWIPGHLFWAYLVGVAFIAAALAILSGKVAPLAGTLLGTMFLLWVLVLHGPRVAHALRNGNEWVSMIVALAMSGGGFVIAGAMAERN